MAKQLVYQSRVFFAHAHHCAKVLHRQPWKKQPRFCVDRTRSFFKHLADYEVLRGVTEPVHIRAYKHLDKVAVVDQHGSHTYAKILYQAHILSDKLVEVQFPIANSRVLYKWATPPSRNICWQ